MSSCSIRTPTMDTWLPAAPLPRACSRRSFVSLPGKDTLEEGSCVVYDLPPVGTPILLQGVWFSARSPRLCSSPAAATGMRTPPLPRPAQAAGALRAERRLRQLETAGRRLERVRAAAVERPDDADGVH